jgi:hypothetical protein
VPDLSFHIRIETIDPQKEEFHVYVAKSMDDPALPPGSGKSTPK